MFLLLLLVSLGGCRSHGYLRGNVFENSRVRLEIEPPGNDWDLVPMRGVDIAFIYPQDESTLLINSQCNEVQDVPLRALLGHLLIGFTEQKIVDEKLISFSEREALIQTIEAKLDGVSRKFKILVLKKDGCVFDIVLATTPMSFGGHEQVFDSLMQHFDAKVREDGK